MSERFILEGTLSSDARVFQVRLEATEKSEAWKLLAPPDRWQDARDISAETVEVLVDLAGRLGLKHTVDQEARKLYLGLPQSPEPVEAGVLYPSGVRLPLVANADERYAGTEEAVPLVSFEPGQKLSEHFTADEFMPRDSSYQYLRLKPELVELLEKLRAELGGHPLTINSGYRPPAYNAEVGGVPRSTHIDGLAADVSSSAVSTERLWEVADLLVGDNGGVGFYPYQQFVHVDLRGHRARWSS